MQTSFKEKPIFARLFIAAALTLSLSTPVEAGVRDYLPQYSLCSILVATAVVASTLGFIRYKLDQEKLAMAKLQTFGTTHSLAEDVLTYLAKGNSLAKAPGDFQPGMTVEFPRLPRSREKKDAFGRPLQLRRVLYQLGDYAPEEGFLVLSAGPDGVFETADDIGNGAPNKEAPDHVLYGYFLEKDEWKQIHSTIQFPVRTRD